MGHSLLVLMPQPAMNRPKVSANCPNLQKTATIVNGSYENF
jgi:hypothetical protein